MRAGLDQPAAKPKTSPHVTTGDHDDPVWQPKRANHNRRPSDVVTAEIPWVGPKLPLLHRAMPRCAPSC
ncbi:MAG: hypothetical protein KTR25_13750 [Myxococcales bacterium]|nr:hypothetical protein [Myxococcales bacterium]